MNVRAKIGKQEEQIFCFGRLQRHTEKSLSRLHHALNYDCQTWLDRIGNERWTRSCFHVVRYNIITSNSADFVNALSRDASKLPIIILIDFFSATMQQWWCHRCNVGGKCFPIL
uniref:Uncharacterized protein n=1 Tax=Lactuca sativa TaxID=4236 RepID=A0A9R1WBX2_LACSA|nr:hypothetical protein LSAT_V11C300138910 [Lactuca sativa]